MSTQVIQGATSCGCGGKKDEAIGTCGLPQDTASEAPVAKKELTVELLFLDLNTCAPCRGAQASLEEALPEVGQVLGAAGVAVTLRKVQVESLEQAEALRFVSSPTIRVNGRDIQFDVHESRCNTCSAIAGTAVDCRSWYYQGKLYSAPPKAMIIEAILRALYGGDEGAPGAIPVYEAPENLKRFFAARGATGASSTNSVSIMK
jgi:hypothetical protein